MRELREVDLATLTTLRVGGPAESMVEASTRDELIEAASSIGRNGCLVLGGGSNLVVSDDGVDVPVIAARTVGVGVERDGDSVALRVAAGEPWDALVERCVDEGWSGVESLSGIPGTVGATPIQNVGAYGQEVCDVVVGVDVFDRVTSRVHTMSADDCQFRYRTSVFKDEPNRFVVLDVMFRLARSASSEPVVYAELAKCLDVEQGAAAPIDDVRAAVLELRRSKGMVLDDADHDTWSAGSFFTNPILAPSEVPDRAPTWSQPDGRVKTSAAWLIEDAGFTKGFGEHLGSGRATLSTKHALAVTNRGGASTDDLVTLARTVRDGVRAKSGVTLHPEPTLVGVHL
jgi:UDP-N-acetylmuramate dehydrogenase